MSTLTHTGPANPGEAKRPHTLVSHTPSHIHTDTYTLLSVMDMESSVSASLDISLSLALVAGAKT
jgi:hypothetical protein